MMSFEIRADLSGLQQLRTELQSLVANATAYIANELIQYEEEVFATEGAVNGKQWKPITGMTAKKRAKHGVSPANPVLQARGELKSAYRIDYDTSFPTGRCSLYFEDVYSVWDEHLVNLPEVHHFGFGFRYPRRPLFNEEVVEKRITERVQTFLGGK